MMKTYPLSIVSPCNNTAQDCDAQLHLRRLVEAFSALKMPVTKPRPGLGEVLKGINDWILSLVDSG